MTLQAALQISVERDEWFRPVSWSGSGRALRVREGKVHNVPHGFGGYLAMFPHPDDVSGEWEVVSPDVVNSEGSP